ncbi:MAG: hypothetical protein ACE5DR_05750 [Thermodesulfobacteriota bacterium]
MASEIKNLVNNPAGLEDIADLLEIPNEGFRAYNYDHCRSLEELRFEILSNLLKDGYLRHTAEEIAREMARDLWNYSEET